jgi:hypothetical protein
MKRESLSLVGLQGADKSGPFIDIGTPAQRLRAHAGNLRSLPSKNLSKCRREMRSRTRPYEFFVKCDARHNHIGTSHAVSASLPDHQFAEVR